MEGAGVVCLGGGARGERCPRCDEVYFRAVNGLAGHDVLRLDLNGCRRWLHERVQLGAFRYGDRVAAAHPVVARRDGVNRVLPAVQLAGHAHERNAVRPGFRGRRSQREPVGLVELDARVGQRFECGRALGLHLEVDVVSALLACERELLLVAGFERVVRERQVAVRVGGHVKRLVARDLNRRRAVGVRALFGQQFCGEPVVHAHACALERGELVVGNRDVNRVRVCLAALHADVEGRGRCGSRKVVLAGVREVAVRGVACGHAEFLRDCEAAHCERAAGVGRAAAHRPVVVIIHERDYDPLQRRAAAVLHDHVRHAFLLPRLLSRGLQLHVEHAVEVGGVNAFLSARVAVLFHAHRGVDYFRRFGHVHGEFAPRVRRSRLGVAAVEEQHDLRAVERVALHVAHLDYHVLGGGHD